MLYGAFTVYGWSSCRYDIQNNTWSFVCSISMARSTAGVAVFGERLYVVGWRNSLSCLNTGESYDPHANKWVQICWKRRSWTHCSPRQVSGHDSLQPLDSVEVFDPCTNQWTLIEPMKAFVIQ